MKISEMASILCVDAIELREDIMALNSPANQAYLNGKNSTKLLLREQEMELAKVGSPQAIQNMREALLDMEDDE